LESDKLIIYLNTVDCDIYTVTILLEYTKKMNTISVENLHQKLWTRTPTNIIQRNREYINMFFNKIKNKYESLKDMQIKIIYIKMTMGMLFNIYIEDTYRDSSDVFCRIAVASSMDFMHECAWILKLYEKNIPAYIYLEKLESTSQKHAINFPIRKIILNHSYHIK